MRNTADVALSVHNWLYHWICWHVATHFCNQIQVSPQPSAHIHIKSDIWIWTCHDLQGSAVNIYQCAVQVHEIWGRISNGWPEFNTRRLQSHVKMSLCSSAERRFQTQPALAKVPQEARLLPRHINALADNLDPPWVTARRKTLGSCWTQH